MTAGGATTVTLTVTGAADTSYDNWPVRVGVPVPEGDLTSTDNVRLLDGGLQETACQVSTLATWPDGSIKWLCLDFLADVLPSGAQYTLEYGPQISRRPCSEPLTVTDDGSYVEIVTGPAKFRIEKAGFSLIDEAWLDLNGNGRFEDWEQCVDQSADYAQGLFLRSAGIDYSSIYDSSPAVTIEESGPIRAVICVKGHHRDPGGQNALLSYQARLYAYRGQSFIGCDYTVINEQGATFDATVDDLRVVMPLINQQQPVTWRLSGDGVVRSDTWDPQVTAGDPQHAFLFQFDHDGYYYGGGAVGSETFQQTGTRIDGWVSVQDATWGLMGYVRYPWQQFPTSLDAYQRTDSCIQIGLWSDYTSGGSFVFDRGMAKTSQVFLDFHKTRTATEDHEQAIRFQTPPLARAPAEWYRDTFVLGPLGVDPNVIAGYAALINTDYDGLLYRQDNSYPGYSVRHWYGFKHWGDWHGESGGLNWGNLEYDLAGGYFTYWLRTGDRRFYDRAETAALHHRDVDVAQEDIISKLGAGLMYKGTMITHCPDHTAGTSGAGHVFGKGICLHYLLTGDARSKQVVQLLGDGFAAAYHANYANGWGGMYNQVHLRTWGWPMVYLANIYDVTGDPNHKRLLDEFYEDVIRHKWEVVNRHAENFVAWSKETWNPGGSVELNPTVFENVHFLAGAGETTSPHTVAAKVPLSGYYQVWARVRPSDTPLIRYEVQINAGGYVSAVNPTYGQDHWSWQPFGVYYLQGCDAGCPMYYVSIRGVNQSAYSFDFKVDEIVLSKDRASYTPDEYIWLEAEDGSSTAWTQQDWDTSPYAPTSGSAMYYFSFPGASEPFAIDFEVTTARPQRYRILGRVRHSGGPVSAESIDYQVRIDSGPWENTTTSGRQSWLDRWQWMEYPPAYLTPGEHRLEVRINNKSPYALMSYVDCVLLTTDDALSLAPENTLYLQAEAGAGWQESSWDTTAFTTGTPAPKGSYQYGTTMFDPGPAGITSPAYSIPLNLSADGAYAVWAKVRCNDNTSIDYQARIDGGDWKGIQTTRLNDLQVWQWVGFGAFSGLSAGAHTLEMRYVNNSADTLNAYIDSLVVTMDTDYVPYLDAKATLDYHRRGNYNVYDTSSHLTTPQVTWGQPWHYGILGLGLIEYDWRYDQYAGKHVLLRNAGDLRNRDELMFQQWGSWVYRSNCCPDSPYYNSFHFDHTHLIAPTLAYAYGLTADPNYLYDAEEFLEGAVYVYDTYVTSPDDPIWGSYYGSGQSAATHSLWPPIVIYYLEQ